MPGAKPQSLPIDFRRRSKPHTELDDSHHTRSLLPDRGARGGAGARCAVPVAVAWGLSILNNSNVIIRDMFCVIEGCHCMLRPVHHSLLAPVNVRPIFA